jgi:hypothetical protein
MSDFLQQFMAGWGMGMQRQQSQRRDQMMQQEMERDAFDRAQRLEAMTLKKKQLDLEMCRAKQEDAIHDFQLRQQAMQTEGLPDPTAMDMGVPQQSPEMAGPGPEQIAVPPPRVQIPALTEGAPPIDLRLLTRREQIGQEDEEQQRKMREALGLLEAQESIKAEYRPPQRPLVVGKQVLDPQTMQVLHTAPETGGAAEDRNQFLRGADFTLTGDAFVQTLPLQFRETAKKVAFHEVALSSAGRGKEMREALMAAAPLINPAWSEHTYAVAREFAKGQPAKARRAINDALADASLALEQSGQFKRSRFPWVNKGKAWFYEQTGRPEEIKLRGTMKNLATEFALAQKNGLAPLQKEIDEMYDRFVSAASPEQLNAIIRNEIEFTANRLVTLENDWERYFGKKPAAPNLNKQTIEKAKRHGFYDLLRNTGVYLGEPQAEAAGGDGWQTVGGVRVRRVP